MLKSFGYAIAGLKAAFGQRNIKIQFCVGVTAIILAVTRRLTPERWAVVIVCIAVVLAAECFNTAIEYLCDTLHPEYSEGIGKVKDISAAAVLVCSIGAAFAGIVVFFV